LENSDIFLWWLVILAIVLPTSQIYRLVRRCRLSNLEEISVAIASIGGTIILANALFKAFTQDNVRADLFSVLEAEGISALLIGSLFAVRLFAKEITKLFPPSEKLDEKTEKLIDRMLDKGLSPSVIADLTQISIQQIQFHLNNNYSTNNSQIGSTEIDSAALPIMPEAILEEKEKDSI
jgi:hypothetical protein